MRQALAPNGRKVKCSKCKTVWFQEYAAPPEIKFNRLNLDHKNKKELLPVVVKKGNSVWGVMLAGVLFFIILALCFVFFQDTLAKKQFGLSGLYDRVGIPSIKGMALQSVEISHTADNQIEINGTIQNNSEDYKRVSPVKISLFDENRKLLKSFFIPAPPRYLDKGNRYSFYKKVTGDFKTKPKVVSVTLANGVEMFFHSLDFR